MIGQSYEARDDAKTLIQKLLTRLGTLTSEVNGRTPWVAALSAPDFVSSVEAEPD
ncbi:MAG: hypothetical protein HY725_02900 [Candidatus Rokubacteria bacterium]|nr:hypothetical protein [Candidatus Rokubacteria bacterium]